MCLPMLIVSSFVASRAAIGKKLLLRKTLRAYRIVNSFEDLATITLYGREEISDLRRRSVCDV